MDDDQLIKKISLDFFDMLYEDLTREQQSVVRKAVEEDKRRTSGVIKRPSAYKAGGGMMNINRMTAPLGYAAGGPASITALEKRGLGEKEFDPREDVVRKTNEMISYLNKRVAEQSFGAEPAANIINDLTGERQKENPDYDRLNEMYLQYSELPDFKDAQVKEEKGMGEKIMQGLGELFGGRGAEAGPLVDFIKTKRARLMSEVSGEMMGNMFGTGVNEDKIKILKIEIDKLTEQLNDLGEN